MCAPRRGPNRGSSPLSRGILHKGSGRSANRWIIPALAGNTLLRTLAGLLPMDHPRSRGEYRPVGSSVSHVSGSSPLSRGIRDGVADGATVSGIIPALAGNTSTSPSRPARSRDHPRSRGEYPCERRASASAKGSSPLSRGIPSRSAPSLPDIGIIPALAGNTAAYQRRRADASDHPRSRGEYGSAPM